MMESGSRDKDIQGREATMDMGEKKDISSSSVSTFPDHHLKKKVKKPEVGIYIPRAKRLQGMTNKSSPSKQVIQDKDVKCSPDASKLEKRADPHKRCIDHKPRCLNLCTSKGLLEKENPLDRNDEIVSTCKIDQAPIYLNNKHNLYKNSLKSSSLSREATHNAKSSNLSRDEIHNTKSLSSRTDAHNPKKAAQIACENSKKLLSDYWKMHSSEELKYFEKKRNRSNAGHAPSFASEAPYIRDKEQKLNSNKKLSSLYDVSKNKSKLVENSDICFDPWQTSEKINMFHEMDIKSDNISTMESEPIASFISDDVSNSNSDDSSSNAVREHHGSGGKNWQTWLPAQKSDLSVENHDSLISRKDNSRNDPARSFQYNSSANSCKETRENSSLHFDISTKNMSVDVRPTSDSSTHHDDLHTSSEVEKSKPKHDKANPQRLSPVTNETNICHTLSSQVKEPLVKTDNELYDVSFKQLGDNIQKELIDLVSVIDSPHKVTVTNACIHHYSSDPSSGQDMNEEKEPSRYPTSDTITCNDSSSLDSLIYCNNLMNKDNIPRINSGTSREQSRNTGHVGKFIPSVPVLPDITNNQRLTEFGNEQVTFDNTNTETVSKSKSKNKNLVVFCDRSNNKHDFDHLVQSLDDGKLSDFLDSKAEISSNLRLYEESSNDEPLEGDAWFNNFDDDGEFLDPDKQKELLSALGRVKIEKPKCEKYYKDQLYTNDDYKEYDHILEIFDFSPQLVTSDLMKALFPFQSRGVSIKWVDETHALAIFHSALLADEALSMIFDNMKLRSVSEATVLSKSKLRSCLDFVHQPYKERPQTSSVTAHRMVAGALGLSPRISEEKHIKELKKLQDARDKKRQTKRDEDDAWSGRCAMDRE